eukprot:4600771-Karenia_brevis.AAC.1
MSPGSMPILMPRKKWKPLVVEGTPTYCANPDPLPVSFVNKKPLSVTEGHHIALFTVVLLAQAAHTSPLTKKRHGQR